MNGQQTYAYSLVAQLVQASTDKAAPQAPQAVIAGADPNDSDLSHKVMKSVHALQAAIDAAAVAGLIIVPSFKSCPGRFKDRGNSADSYIARVEVYRKLV